MTNEQVVAGLVEEAGKHFAQGDNTRALLLFKQALDRSVGNSSALLVLHSNIGAVLLSMGELDSALESLDRALDIDSTHVESQFNKALVLLQQNQYQLALFSFELVCGARPEFYLAWCSKCECLLNLSRFEEAKQAALSAIALEEESAKTAHALLGVTLYHLGEYAGANESFVRAGMDALDAIARQVYSLSLAEEALVMGERDEDAARAVEKMELAISVHPGNWENYHNLGVLLFKRAGRHAADAKVRFEQALERNENSFQTLIALGSLCLDLDELKAGREYFERACTLEPDNALSRFNLGVALVKQGDFPRAREEFTRLLPNDANAIRALELLKQEEHLVDIPRQQQQEDTLFVPPSPSHRAIKEGDSGFARSPSSKHALQQAAAASSPTSNAMEEISIGDALVVKPEVPVVEVKQESPPPPAPVEAKQESSPPPPAPVEVKQESSPSVEAKQESSPPVEAKQESSPPPVETKQESSPPVEAKQESPSPPAPVEAKQTSYIAYEDLKFPKRPPPGVDATRKETYLSPEDFARAFGGRTLADFEKLPAWKRTLMKKDNGLF